MDGRVHFLRMPDLFKIIHWSQETEYMYKGMYFSVTEFSVSGDPYILIHDIS